MNSLRKILIKVVQQLKDRGGVLAEDAAYWLIALEALEEGKAGPLEERMVLLEDKVEFLADRMGLVEPEVEVTATEENEPEPEEPEPEEPFED